MLGLEEPLVTFFAIGTVLTEIGVLAYIALAVGKNFFDLPTNQKFSRVEELIEDKYREIGFFFASLATFGSLYLSNILGWEPCRLCWFQRIFMYPLVLIFGVSLVLDNDNVADYTLPLSLVGLAIAVYHYMIQFLPALQSKGCSITSVSCEATYTFYFGHISVPTMAAAAFGAIALVSYQKFWD